MKPFEKGHLVRVPAKGDVTARIEHMGYDNKGQRSSALVRHPLGKTEPWTWCEWMPLTAIHHIDAIDRLAEIETE